MTQAIDQRLATGVPGLDEILGGGLLPKRTVLLKGAPGTGKTTLGMQMLVKAAMELNEPGLLLSFEQTADQLLEDAAEFGWPLEELLREQKLGMTLVTPEDILQPTGRQESRLLLKIEDWVTDYGARRILIDSMSHLMPLFAREDARAMFMEFVMSLKRMGLTPILTAEQTEESGLAAMDAYLVDTLIHIKLRSGGAGSGMGARFIEVLKSRGTKSIPGEHPMEIGPHGVVIFPRAEQSLAPAPVTAAPQTMPPVSSGIAGLDALLGGGYLPGSTIFVAGLSGTYKTALLAHFALAGEEPAVWVSFGESAIELEQAFGSQGLDVAGARAAGRLTILESRALADSPEKLLRSIEKLVLERGIKRVAIDSPAQLAAAAEPEQKEAVSWFLRRLHGLGVTTLATQALTRVTGVNPLTEIAAPELADTIIYLGMVEIESRLEKVLSVVKHRGGPTGGELVGVERGPQGLRVSERFIGLAGVLSGTALGKRKAQIEEIFQPLFFIRDFLAMARGPEVNSERRDAILNNLAGETGRLIELLSKYFDHPLPEKETGEKP